MTSETASLQIGASQTCSSSLNVWTNNPNVTALSVYSAGFGAYYFRVITGGGSVSWAPTGKGGMVSVASDTDSGGRSISCAGTVNASGNDYAEYITKNSAFSLEAGDIVGIDSNALLTNVFSDAISFVVKSTSPSYVGGDTWGANLPPAPTLPGSDADATAVASYSNDVATWTSLYEAEASLVDMVAFAGRIPVNVFSATPGDYIVPISNTDGSIGGSNVPKSQMSLEQYMLSVGQVLSILPTGQAFMKVSSA